MTTPPADAPPDPVVVGVDGSASSDRAVDTAVRYARRHGRPVRVVHAFEWPVLHLPLGPSPVGPPDAGLAADADRILAHARTRAVEVAQDVVPVSGEVVSGTAAAVLLAEARSAALVVIGDRGLGNIGDLLLGSVAMQVTAHSAVPVMVVRGGDHPQGPVVVGVEESADAALAYAFTEAAAADAEVVAVSAWYRRPSPQTEEALPLLYDTDDIDRRQAQALAERIAPLRDRHPDVTVTERVVHARATRALVEASARAQLLVVGTRGRGGFAGLRMGSVSRGVLQRAECPVVVVPTDQS